ncbi:ABC transporter permease [Streptomyces sp. NBC_01235]|uniref:ABC transporter permease n=1 Tax=Streptomyces sp. NBC_01235 TaxID=2903788 RepID=UPI002E1640CC|nr:ABC transporter permease [Streptomyces sp. NBC_01235]
MTAAVATTNRPPQAGTTKLAMTAFWAILRRDILVTARGFVAFLIQAFMQPLLYLYVFGVVLPKIGIAIPGYGGLLLPGIVTLTVFLAAVQGIMLPLALDLGFTREIDDRLLAPTSIGAIVLEKIIFATLRGLISAAILFPLAYWILGDEYLVQSGSIPLMIGIIVLTAILGSAVGLVIGTVVPSEHIALAFAAVFTPMLFTGCLQYPWASLDDLSVFRVVTLFNPLTYSAEGMRYAMVPLSDSGAHTPSLAIGWVLVGLIGFAGLFFSLGLRSFKSRAIH